MPGYPAGASPQPGYGPPPQSGPGQQSGFPDPSKYQQPEAQERSQYVQPADSERSQYVQPGAQDPTPPQPTSPAPPQPSQQPGYQAGPGPQPGFPSEGWQDQPPPRRNRSWTSGGGASSIEDAIGDVVGEAVLGAATKAIGRFVGRKMRQAYNERVAPAMAARQEAMLNDRAAIAQRHPDLRACLNDQVVFLVGGTRTLPLAGAMQVRTVEQSDALVAQLRGG
jgi:hypothetical protein